MTTDQVKAALVLGGLAGLLFGLVIGGGVAVSRALKTRSDSTKDWQAFPVTALARPVAAGRPLEMNDVVVGSMPERLLTTSHVPVKDVTYVVNQALRVPVVQGQPLEWGFFAIPAAEGENAAQRKTCEAALVAREGQAR